MCKKKLLQILAIYSMSYTLFDNLWLMIFNEITMKFFFLVMAIGETACLIIQATVSIFAKIISLFNCHFMHRSIELTLFTEIECHACLLFIFQNDSHKFGQHVLMQRMNLNLRSLKSHALDFFVIFFAYFNEEDLWCAWMRAHKFHC